MGYAVWFTDFIALLFLYSPFFRGVCREFPPSLCILHKCVDVYPPPPLCISRCDVSYIVASKPLASRPSPPNMASKPPRACCMQDMAPFNMLMLWADLLPPLYMTSILDVEFFPKWLTVLHRWLSNTADYAEVQGSRA